MADDDYVTVRAPRKYPGPRTPGKVSYTRWFETWRFVNGKADEQSDPAVITAPAPHANQQTRLRERLPLVFMPEEITARRRRWRQMPKR
jgi:predicted SnoaL-like aldol condensation-catalyzing enzyme